jgi:hypothetical protein
MNNYDHDNQPDPGDMPMQEPPGEADAMRAAITAHLAYLDEGAADCTKAARRCVATAPPIAATLTTAASVYAEVAAELRHTFQNLNIPTPTETIPQ